MPIFKNKQSGIEKHDEVDNYRFIFFSACLVLEIEHFSGTIPHHIGQETGYLSLQSRWFLLSKQHLPA